MGSSLPGQAGCYPDRVSQTHPVTTKVNKQRIHSTRDWSYPNRLGNLQTCLELDYPTSLDAGLTLGKNLPPTTDPSSLQYQHLRQIKLDNSVQQHPLQYRYA